MYIQTNKGSRFFLLPFFLFFITWCACEEKKSTTAVPNQPLEEVFHGATISEPMLGEWFDVKDSMHRVIFDERNWIDIYNHDTVSVNPAVLYSDFPDKGGERSLEGTIMRLEESPNNYYYFKIELLDSLRLNLHFIDSDQYYYFLRTGSSESVENPEKSPAGI
ncbi:MAG: hypothetical protein K1X56_06140 [Flavobacteriales bacterium]|nr:hypothetical protein [Flavobacteriales bacterium]